MEIQDQIMSDVVTFRTYAKFLPHINRREIYPETVNRSMNMFLDRFPNLSKDITFAFNQVHDYHAVPSMRVMQFGGEAIDRNNVRAFNCSYSPCDSIDFFGELLFLLLSGTGGGISIQSHHTNQLPVITPTNGEMTYVIDDSIQGWAEAVDALFKAYTRNGLRPIFDFSKIRPKGSYLSTTGAKAPGPQPLKKMLSKVESILQDTIGRKLKPYECGDISCHVADCVLAGGVRRSSLILGFDRWDQDMLKYKSGQWWERNPQRALANVSAILPYSETTYEEFCSVYDACKNSGSGEPGFYWTHDVDVFTNPCFAPDTLIKTTDGDFFIKDLVGKSVDVFTYDNKIVTCDNFRITNTNQPIIKIKTTNSTVRCTEYHTMILSDGSRVLAKHLKLGDILLSDTNESVIDIIHDGIEENVYCCTIPITHIIKLANGIFTGQCGEASLNPNTFCNLSSINMTGITSKKEFLRRTKAATIIGTLQATLTNFPYLRQKWKTNTENDSLIGISQTGIADNYSFITPEILQEGAQLVLETNNKLAKKLGINPAKRTTMLKPEGSASVVLGSSSGIHDRHDEYYLRRIRTTKNDPLIAYFQKNLPDFVETSFARDDEMIMLFPQKAPTNAIIRSNSSAMSLFNRILMYNKYWIRTGHNEGKNFNNVSATISVKENEWDELREAMWNNRYDYHGISLLPFDGGTYQQAPFETITEAQYNDMVTKLKPIDLRYVTEETDNTVREMSVACSGGVCSLQI